jgi:hypothetical protein
MTILFEPGVLMHLYLRDNAQINILTQKGYFS